MADSSQARQLARGTPSACRVHAALACLQLCFGGGAVLGKFGVHGSNPALFALLREGIAGPLLCAGACAHSGRLAPQLRDVPRVVAAALGIFSSQLFFILGLKLADPVSGSAWQPSQPVFTAALAILVGYERATARKALSILLAVAGAVFLVLGGPKAEGSGAGLSGAALAGHVLFALNCLGTSVYVIVTKDMLRRYSPVSVAGWANLGASATMLAAACLLNLVPPLLAFVCTVVNLLVRFNHIQSKREAQRLWRSFGAKKRCSASASQVCTDADPAVQARCVEGPWSVPMEMAWPLCYWIVCCSMVAYLLMTWANQYAKPSVVSIYTVLQPCASGLISAILILVKGRAWAEAYGLEAPGLQDLGLLGVVLGLALLFSDRGGSMEEAAGGGSRDVKRHALVTGAAAPDLPAAPSPLLQA